MDICNPPTPLDDIDIFLRSAAERYYAEGGARLRTESELALFFVHTIFTHNGFCLPINEAPPQAFREDADPPFPRTMLYTLCTAPRDERASVTLDWVDRRYLTVKGYWRCPGSLSYEARFDFSELAHSLVLVFRSLLHGQSNMVDYGSDSCGEQELGVLRRFWREVEVNVCRPLQRQW